MLKTCCFSTSIFWGSGLDFGASWASKSAALLAAPGVLDPTAFYACINILLFLTRGGQDRPKTRGLLGYVGAISAHFSLLSASWVHFWRLAAFVAPFGRFFHDLGRSSLDFGAPSWPYVGTHFALDGIFRHAAGIAAKKPCWHSLSAFRFHYAARRYVRSTWNRTQVGSYSPTKLLNKAIFTFLS